MKTYHCLTILLSFLLLPILCCCQKEDPPQPEEHVFEYVLKLGIDEYNCLIPGGKLEESYNYIKKAFETWSVGLPKWTTMCTSKDQILGSFNAGYSQYWNPYVSKMSRLEEQFGSVSDEIPESEGSFFLRYSFCATIDGQNEKVVHFAFAPRKYFYLGEETFPYWLR